MRAASGANHDRHRRREAERARTRDDQHGHGVHDGMRKTRLRSEGYPPDECHERDCDHGRNKPASNFVRQPLDRGSRALRLADHLHDLRQHGLAADAVGAHHERSVAVYGRADHTRGRRLLHGRGLACDHGLVHCAQSFEHYAVHRDLFSGADSQPISRLYLFERDVALRAAFADQARHLRA